MEVKPGYKQTEVGVIPEGWEVLPFGQLAHIERGKFTARPRNDPRYYGGDIPFIQTGDVTNAHGQITTYSQTLNAEGLKVSKLFPGGTLFFTIAANIGDVGFAAFDTACPDSLVAITPTKTTDKAWLFYALAMRKSSFESLASLNAQLNINLEKLRPYLLPHPTLREQHAIASALSDVDGLLGALDRLIVKKRDLKQAAMQQLLTGQTRLPGFTGEWKLRRLEDTAVVLKGAALSKSKLSQTGARPCVLYGELFTVYGQVIEDVVSRTDSPEGIPSVNGDVLMPGSTTTTGIDLATASALLRDDVALGGDIIIIRRKDQKMYDPVFMANYLTEAKQQEISELTQGITIHHLYGKDLRSLEVSLPSLDEQSAIARVLSDMDAELTALEERRDKTRAIKQGMMQELLTGRIRLVTPDGSLKGQKTCSTTA